MAQTVAVNRSKYEDKQPLKQPPVASGEPPSKRGRQAPKPVRGVFEQPPNSGIWWVNYYVDGKRHREKVGTRKAASDLYSKRKNDARMGVKLPDSLKAKRAILFEELAKDAMEYSKAHKKSHRGDISNLSSLLPVFGKTKAEEITPQTISAYFSTRTDLKPASINRYRSTMSMIFAEGTLGVDIELHHPVRDGRPAIPLSKRGHDLIERQLSSEGDGPMGQALCELRRKGNRSWVQLRLGCLDLIGKSEGESSKRGAANNRAFAKKAAAAANVGYEEILEWLKGKGL